MTKFTKKEIELLKVVDSYKKSFPTQGQIALRLNKDQRTISGAFFRMRKRHGVKDNEALLTLFKERYNINE